MTFSKWWQLESEAMAMAEDDDFKTPDAVFDAIFEEGKPAEKAFRENAGVSVPGLAESVDMSAERLLQIEEGATPTDEELAAISDALKVPVDLLTDE